MKNPNYRIIVEPISDEAINSFPEELRGGVECEGYVLIADQGDRTEVGIQRMSKADIAVGIANTPLLLASAHIAKAIREAREIEEKEGKSEIISRLMKKIMDSQNDK